MRNILSAFGKLAVLALIAAAFLAGLVLTVYLSLRSPQIQVPDVVNKTYYDGQTQLARAGLDIRERAKRFKPGVQPGLILDQSPRPGEVIKEGQTVAVVVSRAPKEGEEEQAEQAEQARLEEPVAGKGNANANGSDSASNSNRAENQNRERRRPQNRNVNSAANANSNTNGNRNAAANTNAVIVNSRNANSINRNAPRNVNVNANAGRPTPAPRNENSVRPAGANANRRPNP